jgi:probable HAF family extracellular repeat protein
MSTHNNHDIGCAPGIPGGNILARGAFLLALGVAAGAPAQEFTPLGDLAGGAFSSFAVGVSADGTVVVGFGNSASGMEAFRWTAGGGMVGLGFLGDDGVSTGALGVSDDGTVVVGFSSSASGSGEAFRWTEGGGMVGLGFLGGVDIPISQANRVSADGTVVVGFSVISSGQEAFRWTEGGGMVGLGDFAGGTFESAAQGVSADGAVVVGFGTGASGQEAFRWTAGGGMAGLGDLAGGDFRSQGADVSADGTVVVGVGTSASGLEAIRWTEGGGMIGLGDLAGGDFTSSALSVSGDGTVIVGLGTTAAGFEPFIWADAEGMQSVWQLLEDDGIDLTGWSQGIARDVSDDGSVIVGSATNPDGNNEAWIARLGEGGGGIVFPGDLMASARTLPEAARAMEFGGSAASAALLDLAINHGCGERKGAATGRSYCIYGAGDGELLLENPEDGAIGALSAGILFAGPDTLRFGGGPVVLGGSADLESDGETDFGASAAGSSSATAPMRAARRPMPRERPTMSMPMSTGPMRMAMAAINPRARPRATGSAPKRRRATASPPAAGRG